MNRICNIAKHLFAGASLCLIFQACENKDLCFNHDEHAPKSDVKVEATYQREWQFPYNNLTDWAAYKGWMSDFGMEYSSLIPGIPAGLRLMVYNTDDSHDMINLPAEGGTAHMRPGNHSLLFFNNDTEFIVFDDMYTYAAAKATTRTRTRTSYSGNPFKQSNGTNEKTVTPPDMLYGSFIEQFTANRSHVEALLPVTMHPLTYTYLIRYEFEHGQQYVALARGAISGMAEYVWLHNGNTSSESATILFDCSTESFGAQAVVKSFGVPDFPNTHYPTRELGKYALNLEIRLKNGKIKSFDFDVTDQMQKQPQGGVIVVKGIKISDAEGSEGGSGFDVTVDDWGEWEDIDIEL